MGIAGRLVVAMRSTEIRRKKRRLFRFARTNALNQPPTTASSTRRTLGCTARTATYKSKTRALRKLRRLLQPIAVVLAEPLVSCRTFR